MRINLSQLTWPVIIILSAAAAGYMVLGEVQSVLRPLIVFWFLLVCPGMAFVRLLNVKNHLFEWTLAIAFSLALDAIIAGISLFSRTWSVELIMYILIGLSVVGAYLQLLPVDDETSKVENIIIENT